MHGDVAFSYVFAHASSMSQYVITSRLALIHSVIQVLCSLCELFVAHLLSSAPLIHNLIQRATMCGFVIFSLNRLLA